MTINNFLDIMDSIQRKRFFVPKTNLHMKR